MHLHLEQLCVQGLVLKCVQCGLQVLIEDGKFHKLGIYRFPFWFGIVKNRLVYIDQQVFQNSEIDQRLVIVNFQKFVLVETQLIL